MAESQPPTIVEGATTGDVDDEIPVAAKSAEDRKAAAALSSLDAPREDDSTSTKDVDQEAVRKAMDRLAGSGSTNGTASKKEEEKKVVKKAVKVDQADVALLVRFEHVSSIPLRPESSQPSSLLEHLANTTATAPSYQMKTNVLTLTLSIRLKSSNYPRPRQRNYSSPTMGMHNRPYEHTLHPRLEGMNGMHVRANTCAHHHHCYGVEENCMNGIRRGS
jgi:hypothetical protein